LIFPREAEPAFVAHARVLGKLKDDEVWARGHENEKCIGNLVLHLNGKCANGSSPLSAVSPTRAFGCRFATRGAEPTETDRAFRQHGETGSQVLETLKLSASHTALRFRSMRLRARSHFHVVEHSRNTPDKSYSTKMLTGRIWVFINT